MVAVCMFLLVECTFGICQAASADSLRDLYVFCSQGACADGSQSTAPLLMDDSGHLFGTTSSGGQYGVGVVFELSPQDNGGWKYNRLYSFCLTCSKRLDRHNPTGALVLDVAGNFYGVASSGGPSRGVVYELSPNVDRTRWSYKVLHRFCPRGGDPCYSDANQPIAGLTYAGASTTFRTTVFLLFTGRLLAAAGTTWEPCT
jgi:uncharacterized repeat protein (TIGR03803 family)